MNDGRTFFCIIYPLFFYRFWSHCWWHIIGSVGSFLTGDAPLSAMNRIAHSLKIWAIVAAIGGTLMRSKHFKVVLLDGGTIDLFKQILIILSAMIGVKTAMISY